MIKEENLPEGYFSEADVQEYRRLAKKIAKNGTICEIGCFKGRSICSIADIIKHNNLNVYLVDTFKGTEGEHSDQEVAGMKQTLIKNLSMFGILKNVTILEMESVKASKKIEPNSIDLLFIDADHSKEAVIQDIKSWLPAVKRFGYITGHDVHFGGVSRALDELKLLRWVDNNSKSSIWSIKKKKLMKDNGEVVAYICTKDRYHNLYIALMAVINQTQKPDGLIVFDDSEEKFDLTQSSEWRAMFRMLNASGIKWHFINTNDVGQVVNHNRAIDLCLAEFLWRVDDDCIPQPNVLEKLYFHITNSENEEIEVGAVGGKIVTDRIGYSIMECSSYIADIFKKPNLQLAIDAESIYRNVEHLHCSFLYKRNTGVRYDERLSKVGHREETLFSYGLYKADYKLIVDLSAVTLHTKSGVGGIRSSSRNKEKFFESDEDIFLSEIGEDIIKKKILAKETNLVVLDNGIGDHFAFKSVLDDILKQKGRITLAVCYPEVFKEYVKPNDVVNIVSISEAIKIVESLGMSLDMFNVYAYMYKTNWKRPLAEAYKSLYL